MRSSHRRVPTVLLLPGASLLTTLLVWGCAQSGTGDIGEPSVDPTLPELDASWTPTPDQPSAKMPDAGKGDTGAASSGGEEEPEPPPTALPTNDAGSAPPPSAPKPLQGEVLITEVMYDPLTSEPATEWIELHNAASAPRSLSGLTLVDGANRTHVIGTGLTLAPGAFVVLARNKAAAIAAKVPAAAIVYEYGAGLPDNAGIQLANGATGGVSLRSGTTTIAQADYGGWYSQSGGSSIQLATLTFQASAQSSGWCISMSTWTAGSGKGTPGAASDCP